MFLLVIIGLLTFQYFIINSYKIDKKWKVLISILLIFQGLSVTILDNKIPWYIGLILFLVSGWNLFNIIKVNPANLDKNTITSSFLNYLTKDGKYIYLFLPVGLVILLLDLVANATIFDGKIGSNDLVVISAAFVWCLYGFIPENYSSERDFVFLFINILVIILVLPLLIFKIYTLINPIVLEGGTNSTSILQDKIVNRFLTVPLSKVLSFVGFKVLPQSNILNFYLNDGTRASVEIAESCSGIYSVVVFVAAFIAFIGNEYNRFDMFVLFLLILGILTAYFSNLIRMTIIVLVGHYYGIDNMLFVHSNIGWIIFLIWISIFWSLLFYILPKQPNQINE
tara:strand:- start:1137 stop:2153 length:1017 start_codon:yes stop_codon:yes gene_type:complete